MAQCERDAPLAACVECVSVAGRYMNGGIYEPGGIHTRGLYYRDVE